MLPCQGLADATAVALPPFPGLPQFLGATRTTPAEPAGTAFAVTGATHSPDADTSSFKHAVLPVQPGAGRRVLPGRAACQPSVAFRTLAGRDVGLPPAVPGTGSHRGKLEPTPSGSFGRHLARAIKGKPTEGSVPGLRCSQVTSAGFLACPARGYGHPAARGRGDELKYQPEEAEGFFAGSRSRPHLTHPNPGHPSQAACLSLVDRWRGGRAGGGGRRALLPRSTHPEGRGWGEHLPRPVASHHHRPPPCTGCWCLCHQLSVSGTRRRGQGCQRAPGSHQH